MNFSDRLIEAIQAKNSVLCVGLDPRLNRIPTFILKQVRDEHGDTFKAAAEAFLIFNKGIIDAVADLVPIVKPQIAFYEQYGSEGMRAFEETCSYARSKGLLVLSDAKLNDIGSTAEAYAGAFLGEVDLFGESVPSMDVDALTLTAYMGYDGIKPFIDVAGQRSKGLFVNVKNSNPSSEQIQDRQIMGEGGEPLTVYELMGYLVESWGQDFIGEHGYHPVGAVVGATYPKELEKLRMIMPGAFFLVPGYGAQGATAEDVRGAFDEQGLGALISSSRGIIFAYEKAGGTKNGEDFAEAARDAVLKSNKELNAVRL